MIDKIIEILEDNFDDYDEIAMQEKFIKIATEIDKITYPKEFVEWINWDDCDENGTFHFIRDYTTMKWIDASEHELVEITTDELYEYWQNLKK